LTKSSFYGIIKEKKEVLKMAKRGKVFHKNGARVLPPANDVEFECYNKLTADGYTVIKSGYPDLFCFKDGKIVLI
jgi:hypothetical protein